MGEKICETCGRRLGVLSSECNGYNDPDGSECLRLGYERTLARADRYEAEFSACKALLIAAQQRAERAEAERATALEDAGRWLNVNGFGPLAISMLRALAALPVEPARRQVTENANASEAAALREALSHTEAMIAERWGEDAPQYPRAYGYLASAVRAALRESSAERGGER